MLIAFAFHFDSCDDEGTAKEVTGIANAFARAKTETRERKYVEKLILSVKKTIHTSTETLTKF